MRRQFSHDLNSLKEMADKGNLKELFPQLFLRDKIENALKVGHTAPPQTQLKTSPITHSKQDLPDNGLTMPAGKLYGCFASHKKTHSKHGDACEVNRQTTEDTIVWGLRI